MQANELNLHAIGIDISAFNAFISNSKIAQYDIADINKVSNEIIQNLIGYQKTSNNVEFEAHLLDKLKTFNTEFFPSSYFKYQVRHNQIDEKSYGKQKIRTILRNL